MFLWRTSNSFTPVVVNVICRETRGIWMNSWLNGENKGENICILNVTVSSSYPQLFLCDAAGFLLAPGIQWRWNTSTQRGMDGSFTSQGFKSDGSSITKKRRAFITTRPLSLSLSPADTFSTRKSHCCLFLFFSYTQIKQLNHSTPVWDCDALRLRGK